MEIIFSIIIPTYNSSGTINKCLDSLLCQSCTNFEVLIQDGVSTDDTLDLINKYNDDRIKVYSEKDSGVYDAMNKGIDKASGEWLYFLGSDDVLYNSQVLSQVCDFMEEEYSDIIYGNAYFVGTKKIHDGYFTREKIFTRANICHQSIFYRRDVFSKLGRYNLDFPLYADWDFNIRCFSHPEMKIKFVDLIIVYYNDLSGISNSGVLDSEFFKISGFGLNEKIETLSFRIQKLENSLDFKVGNILLLPLRLIKMIFKKK